MSENNISLSRHQKKNRSICIKSRIWEMKRGKYTKILAAKIQASTFFHTRDILAEMIYRYLDSIYGALCGYAKCPYGGYQR